MPARELSKSDDASIVRIKMFIKDDKMVSLTESFEKDGTRSWARNEILQNFDRNPFAVGISVQNSNCKWVPMDYAVLSE